jgi:hypothetical protein
MNRETCYFICVLGGMLLTSTSALFAEKTPADLFLILNVHEDSFFEIASRNKEDNVYLEKIKIRYLIEAVRKSSLTFIRNHEAYRGTEAAAHLSWKYSFAGKRVQTPHDFIEEIASQSIQTGSRYLVKTSEGKTYLLSDVLYNELERLERSLGSKK